MGARGDVGPLSLFTETAKGGIEAVETGEGATAGRVGGGGVDMEDSASSKIGAGSEGSD